MVEPTLIAPILLIAQVIIFILLIIGSRLGFMLEIELHHKFVYPIVAVQILIIGIWMLPRAISKWLPLFFDNPLTYSLIVIHMLVGSIAIILSIYVSVAFLLDPDLSLKRLRKMVPLMHYIPILWLLALILGGISYFVYY